MPKYVLRSRAHITGNFINSIDIVDIPLKNQRGKYVSIYIKTWANYKLSSKIIYENEFGIYLLIFTRRIDMQIVNWLMSKTWYFVLHLLIFEEKVYYSPFKKQKVSILHNFGMSLCQFWVCYVLPRACKNCPFIF